MFRWTLHLEAQGSCHAAVVVENKVYCFQSEEVHIFNTVSLRWTKVSPGPSGRGPPRRPGHTAVLIGNIAYVWGGCKTNVLYAFDVDTHRWFEPEVSGTVPEARQGHSACVSGKVMYIYGGVDYQRYIVYRDVHKMDTTTMVWALINTRGAPSSSHSATMIGTQMFVFRDEGSNQWWKVTSNYSIRVFDTESNCWLRTTSAPLLPNGLQMENHAAFAYNGELYIFQCYRLNGSFKTWKNDMWKLNPETFSWKEVEPKGKGPRGRMTSMCCYMVGDRIILFGQHHGWHPMYTAMPTDDLYILDVSQSLKTLCKLAVIRYSLERSELPHNIKWELAAMTTNSK